MKQAGTHRSILALGAVILLSAGAAFAGTATAESTWTATRHHGQVQIVRVDEDGQRHIETYVVDSDRPGGYLGVLIGGADDGAKILKVIDDSPAERAGLQAGDVLVGFAGNAIDSPGDLHHRVRGAEPGDVVDVEILRDGVSRTYSIELAEQAEMDFGFNFEFQGELTEHMEQLQEHLEGLERGHSGVRFHLRHQQRPRLGVQLIEATPDLREHLGGTRDAGVLVSRVLPDMPAAEAGVQVGDLIVALDDREIEDAGDLVHELMQNSGRSVYLDVIRDGRPLTLTVLLPEDEEPQQKPAHRGPRT